MATLREECLPILEDVRILFHQLGFRQYSIILRLIDWDGGGVGKGNKTVTNIPITHRDIDGYSGYNPAVRRLSQKDILASAGRFQDLDLRIGPITPEFFLPTDDGGRPVDYFDPDKVIGREFYFHIAGPGIESGGGWFKKIAQETERNWSYYFVVRKHGGTPPSS